MLWQIPQTFVDYIRKLFPSKGVIPFEETPAQRELAARSSGGSMMQWAMPVSVISASVFLTSSALSQDLRDVTLKFLQHLAVPCVYVTKVESAMAMDETAVCEDGREWALFWLENEVAFVDPATRELYRWRPDLYKSQPQLYGSLSMIPRTTDRGPNDVSAASSAVTNEKSAPILRGMPK